METPVPPLFPVLSAVPRGKGKRGTAETVWRLGGAVAKSAGARPVEWGPCGRVPCGRLSAQPGDITICAE